MRGTTGPCSPGWKDVLFHVVRVAKAAPGAIPRRALVHIAQGAGAGTPCVTAGATGTGRRGRRALSPNGKHRELTLQLRGVTFGAFGLLLAVDESLEPVLAFPADKLKNGHGQLQIHLH